MKIGIQCLSLETNYGGILQAFALQTVLKNMGHDVVHFNMNNRHITSVYKELCKTIIYTIMQPSFLNTKKQIEKKFKVFIDEYIHTTPILNNKKDWDEFIQNNEINLLIAGSDQVWRYDYNKTYLEECFLDYTRSEIKRISYAASLGVSNLSLEMKDIFRKYLPNFTNISVREKNSITILKDLGFNSFFCLDPTLLLKAEDYVQLFNLKRSHNNYDNNVFVYILDNDEKSFNQLNSKIKDLGYAIDFVDGHDVSVNNYKSKNIQSKPTVIQWINKIYNSKFVITDSFHGVIFSLIFNKPFYVKINKERGIDRFLSILNLVSLEDRIIDNFGFELLPVDYNLVNKVLEKYREESLNYLKNSI